MDDQLLDQSENGALFSQGGDLGELNVELRDNKLGFRIFTKTIHGNVSLSKRFPLHKWTHLTITHDGFGKIDGVNIFINGKQDKIYRGSLQGVGSTKLHEPRFDFAYCHSDVSGYTAAAVIDEFRCYELQLTTEDIKEVMKYRGR